MDSNISELVKLGHERADELKAACGAVDVRSVAQLISDLASQLEVQYVRAEESLREFRSADITMQNLEAKCEKLAAENTELNKFIAESCFVQAGEVPSWHQAIDHVPETPATDAFLAEVRAQGADECVRQLVTSDDDGFSDAPNICAMVAHQLRKGVQS